MKRLLEIIFGKKEEVSGYHYSPITKREKSSDFISLRGLEGVEEVGIPKGFNPTIGGKVYLPSLTSIPEGFNPIRRIEGDLDLTKIKF